VFWVTGAGDIAKTAHNKKTGRNETGKSCERLNDALEKIIHLPNTAASSESRGRREERQP